jgi:hypothetical protein
MPAKPASAPSTSASETTRPESYDFGREGYGGGGNRTRVPAALSRGALTRDSDRRAPEDRAHGRRPPLGAAVRRRCSARVEVACDLTQALACGMLCSDAVCDAARNSCRPSRFRSTRWPSSRPSSFRHQPPQLVDGNQPGAPRHLDRLDDRQDAPVERRAADAENLGRLRPRVGEPLDARRLANDHRRRCGKPGRRRRVSLRFLTPAPQATAGHFQSVHKP